MIEAGDLKKGTTLKLDNNLYRVMTTTYNKPGRGTASMRASLLDIRTGQTSQRTFNADERLENIFVETEPVQFLYRDGHFLNFMNTKNYEQYQADATLFGEDDSFLRENLDLELRLYEGSVIDYILPTTIVYEVVDAEMAIAGDSTGNVLKRITLDTGKEVKAPLFVNVGDKVQIDTRDGSYLSRA